MNIFNTVLCFVLTGIMAMSNAYAQYESKNVILRSQVSLSDLPSYPESANDCWGYVSGSGREYALLVVRDALVIVDITVPYDPVTIEYVTHTGCYWGDVKVYRDYAYVVNECGGGMDIVDLSGVDDGIVTFVQRFTEDGLDTAHNLAIDKKSGFLYLCLPNINEERLVAYDLIDPENPELAGMMSSAKGGDGLHDAQVITYKRGPYAGRQICFGAGEGRGLDIYDVTDKSNMFRISRTPYPDLAYAHQCWINDNRRFLYLNDELDNINRTLVFDVTNLKHPKLVNEYSSGVSAIDHNIYVRGKFIFEAEYTAGLRVFCAKNPVEPQQVGWFDTYPENDESSYNGAWSVYPFFPSGIVIVSDVNRGLFVLDVSLTRDTCMPVSLSP
ncbi:MAG: choice-of-anchor B family protein [Candidatus Kuenenia sp.]|nr:choice-of-anchor B family protein [Candidatus Kuenenia hertensis]